jgi:hypothetical protein
MPARMNKNKSSSKTTKPKCDRCGGGHASAKCKSFKAPRNVPIDDVARGALRGELSEGTGPGNRGQRIARGEEEEQQGEEGSGSWGS